MQHTSRNNTIAKQHVIRDCFNPVIISTLCPLATKISAIDKPTFIAYVKRSRTKVPRIGKPTPKPY